MKKLSKRAAVLAALFFLTNSLTELDANAEEFPETAITAESPDASLPDEAPAFHACIEYSFQGYVAKGSFTEIPPDIDLIQPLYSLDNETYQTCGEPWDLHWLNMEDAGAQKKLQNQVCLHSNYEPLKSYLDGKLDRFYLKLRLVLKNGTTYETQESLIDRGSPQPIPEELHANAKFASSVAVYETRPFYYYGKYQLTVSADASMEEIASFLPDTLPVEIQLEKGSQLITQGVIDCPVTWKPLSLPRLTAGESVTIDDAAEEIVIPEGTLLNTPTGIFRLDKPLKLYDKYGFSDKVQLVLNAASEDGAPTGVLTEERDGLEMAFHLKPTGATAIHAHVLSENSSAWISLPDLSLLEAVNAQPSTASSGYALVLDHDQEPYRSYLAEKAAGNSPAPFLIGLTIEGGIYNGRQLILAWPDTYDPPLHLPKLDGSGGNEANAGAGNKNDSTPEGQRPNLPQDSEDHNDAQEPQESSPQDPKDTPPAPSAADTPSQTGSAANIILPSQIDPSTKISPEHDDTSSHRNHPQEPEHTSHDPVSSIQQSVTAQPVPNTPAAETPSSAAVTADETNDPQTETAETDEKNGSRAETTAQEPQPFQPAASSLDSSVPNGNTDAKEMSGLQEIPERSAADKSRRTFLPLTAMSFAGIGIVIASAARRMMADRKSRRILSILQKLHHKCRTLARR